MEILKKALLSRGNWTTFALFLLNAIPAIHDFLPAQLQLGASIILALLIVYFKMFPSANYNDARVQAMPISKSY